MVQCIEAPVSDLSAIDAVAACNPKRFIQQLDLNLLNRRFAQASPQEILAWCTTQIPTGLVQTTSFSFLAISHMLYEELDQPVPVVFLDTLHLFPETLETARKAQVRYQLDLHTYSAVGASSRESFAARYGENLWETDIDRFYELTKVESLQRALSDLNAVAWITGRRRDQSESRKDLPIFERDDQGRLKINPLAHWTRKDIWAYIFKHDVLYNPLHDQGYTSIGDQPLTTRTSADEDERAGRWRGTEKTECGIHL
ncbi:phosphoadenosine phosphosulfate reductase [Synechococcus sp. PCC 7335]|uniref:phosphoadenosine phosphosulfate reductase n=1 Tax=Synechococcus sp. (strain ATCC 29403 / PCC 7335) TaxID=91464 RepID=UPI00017EE012|nr:phosphoadenosine phosphosulfate reductase [Synechococcus sp. PCC 7335]EDX86927.1 phosphoadenosine phosphosulfate reductase [Synechococcus sp. PCC 7335]